MVGGAVMTSVFALLAQSILLMALILAVFQVKRWKKYWPVPYIMSAIIIVMPIAAWLVIEFSLGYFSDVSMATIFVCLVYILGGMRPKVIPIEHSFKLFVLLIGFILFPSSLGATEYDLFALGFPSEGGFNVLIIGFTLCGLMAWYKQATQLAVYITMVMCSYSLRIYETDNIWVYIVDPIVMLIFIVGYLNLAIHKIMSFVKNRLVNNV